MKKIEFLSVLLFVSVITFGQGSSYDLPKIVPSSPTAQNFMRYGEIPIDYSTGVPNIEIPIYTVEGRQLKVPISISYHASGIKVKDIASEVGLGWALNCGGLVSRSINGRRDEAAIQASTYDNAEELLTVLNAAADQGYNQTSQCFNGIRDFEYFLNQDFSNEEDPMKDRYFYKLPTGLSGIFTYDFENGDNPITLPYRPLKIEKFVGSGTGFTRIESFKITDDKGVVYTFQTYLENPTQDYSEWFIKEIISADGTDTITFNYILQPSNLPTPTLKSHVYHGWAENTDVNCGPQDIFSSMSQTLSPLPQFSTPVLESIVSSKAIVKFEYASRNDFNYLKRLVKITIAPVDSPTDIIRQVNFIPKYFGTTDENRRLGLDSVIINAEDNQPQKYAFVYESQVLPPYPFKMTSPTYSEDYWGYYNGNNSGNDNTLIPSDFITNTFDKQTYGGNREAGDYYYSRACMLKEIKYPTGGKTVFEFERYYSLNAYPYHANSFDRDGYIGGFRVANITNYSDNSTVSNVKTYEYELPVTRQIGIGYFNYDQSFIEENTNCYATFSREMVYSSPLLPLEVAPGMPVMYQKVTEYNGTPANNAGKAVYTYGQPYSPSDYFNNPEHPLEFEAQQYYHPYHYDKGNYVPELLSKTVYSFDGTNYHRVSKEEYVFTKLFATTFNTGIKLSRTKQFPGIDYWCFHCPHDPTICSSIFIDLVEEYKASVVAIDTKAYQEASLMTNSKSYVYDPFDDTKYVLTSTDYTYNEENLAIKEKTTLSSKGELLKTTYKYPHDYTGTVVYDNMVSRNMISPAIEEQSYKNSDFLRSIKKNYNFWNGVAWSTSSTNQILPQTVDTRNFNQSEYETRLRYHAYDTKSNPLTISNENDVKISYIWNYNLSYPIARVTNASQPDIAHASFEADSKGNWVYLGTPAFDATAPTGKKVYNVNSGGLSKTGLTPGIAYILSYWYKTGASISVTGGTSEILTGPTRNGWTFARRRITSATNIGIGGAGDIDEVRLYPVNSLMTSFTYEPLIGMTGQCDENNNITYFEYDEFNRLALVRDQDRNILKKYCYNYAGEPEDCSTTYHNDVDYSGTYYSQTCPSGQVPNSIYVSVPIGSHTSGESVASANAAAQQYAQNYANQNGTCSSPGVDLYYDNSAFGEVIYVVLTNVSTSQQTYYEISSPGYSYLGTIPEGTYNVEMGNMSGNQSLIYEAGSGCTSPQMGHPVFFYNVVFDSFCYILSIY